MFDLLQHPPQSQERVPLGAGVSIAVHATLVLALLTGAQHAIAPPDAVHESIIESAINFLLPPDQPAMAKDAVKAKWSSMHAGSPKVAEPEAWVDRPAPAGVRQPDTEDSYTPETLETAAAAQNAFTLLNVDSAAVRDPSSAVPRYPVFLEQRGVEGKAVVRFVVDTTGLAELSSFRVIETNHPLFGSAVREALPRMKFSPATVGAGKVRQLVEIPFGFRILRQAAGSARRP